jgi:hypothetical protein
MEGVRPVMDREPGRKLVGWKKIAEYLGTSPRTVQRWERERGLPVQRVPASAGHSVFADAGELDCWFASDGARAAITSERSEARIDIVAEPDPSRGVRLLMRRYPALRAAGLAALVIVLVLGAGLVRAHSLRWPTSAPFHTTRQSGGVPSISSVTRIEARADQVIVIKGQGLGTHCYYSNQDVPFIAIRDKTASWAAGRIIPENWDEVTLNVARWVDSEVVVTGFAGAYGRSWWKLSPGDLIEIAIWNPQTHSGPAVYHLTVAASQFAKK